VIVKNKIPQLSMRLENILEIIDIAKVCEIAEALHIPQTVHH